MITIDITKAKEVWKNKIRFKRGGALRKLDLDFIKAQETSSDTASIVADKQTLRDLPLGNFIAFPAEILRTGSNLITLGARELTSVNPYIRQMGARRLIGASATFGGIGTVIGGTAQAITGVSDEMMQKARSFVP